MQTPLDLLVGLETWSLQIPPDRLRLAFPDKDTQPPGLVQEMTRQALEHPLGMDAPIHRALTPEDRVCIVVDEELPNLAEMVSATLLHIQQAGVQPNQVVLLVAPPTENQPWIDDLPDELGDVQLEVHDPDDQQKLSYLATTKTGERVYLNRTLLEASSVLVLAGRRYDQTFGYLGAEVSIYPAFSDTQTRSTFAKKPMRPPERRNLASEIAWLSGLPMFIQPIEGIGDTIAEVVATLPQFARLGMARQNARWRTQTTEKADTVIAAIGGDAERIRFTDLARAIVNSARLLKPNGRIVLLSDAAPDVTALLEHVRDSDDATDALRSLKKLQDFDTLAASRWLQATRRSHLSVLSGYEEDIVEDLFATPIEKPSEVQRLIDRSQSVIVLHDAHKCRVG